MPNVGRTAEEIAQLRADVIAAVVAGDAPREAAAKFGIGEGHAFRILREWRQQNGITKRALREMRIAARMSRPRSKSPKEVNA